MQKIYNYDAATGEYLGEGEARVNPVKPGHYLIPAGATNVRPPVLQVRQAAVFLNGVWEPKPDWRQAVLYDKGHGGRVRATKIGQLPDHLNATEKPRPGPAYVWMQDGWRVDDVLAKTLATRAKAAQVESAAAQVQAHLDAQAVALGYDNIFTAVTYATEPAVQKFQADGAALRAWRSLVWAKCYEVLTEVEAGTRGPLSAPQLLALLPPFSREQA